MGPSLLANGTLFIGTWSKEVLSEQAIALLKQEIDRRRSTSMVSSHFYPTKGGGTKELSKDEVVFYPVGSELWLECLPGFTASEDGQVQEIATMSTTCLDEDVWEKPFPECQLIVCPNVTSLQNGQLLVEGFRFRQSVFYSCELGYSLMGGGSSRTCQENGTWSGEEPICQPLFCPEPAVIPNGFILDPEEEQEEENAAHHLHPLSVFEYGSVVVYRCQPGHQLIGGAERICGEGGQWSGQPPACVNTSQTCLVPQLLSSGYLAFDGGLEVGSRAWYDCNDQYVLSGNAERVCLENGSWSGNEVVCQSHVTCNPIVNLPNGKVVGNSFAVESSLQFACNPGYNLVGHSTISCTREAVWDRNLPVCVPTMCEEPSVFLNGRIRGSARRFGDSIVYECQSGFTLLGPQVRRCGLNGQWSEVEPHCTLITCPELPRLANGIVESGWKIPGDKARFACDIGWQLVGQSNITCTNNGSWAGEMPKCLPSICRFLPGTVDSSLLTSAGQDIFKEYTVGTNVSWHCPDGLKMQGSSVSRCLPTGEWDVQPPSCLYVDCKDVLNLENGVIFGTTNTSFQMEVRFSCDNGYHKIVDSIMECQLNGKWKGTVPICSRRVCPKLEEVDNAIRKIRPHGQTYLAEYECKEGYEIHGASRLFCRNDNRWSSKIPRCVLTYCPRFKDIPKMTYTRSRVRLGESLKFECEQGYILSGSAFVKCKEQGSWDQPFPYCQPEVCSFSRKIRHGNWRLLVSSYKKELWSKGITFKREEKEDEAVISVGDSFEVSCDAGYEVSGESRVTCLTSMVLSAEVPKCKPGLYCPLQSGIEHGYLVYNGTYRGATLTYYCDEGYKIEGGSERKCRRNKTWSKTPPVCTVVTCPQPHSIAHGLVDYNRSSGEGNLIYGSNASFYCDYGYELIGNSIRTCGADGVWVGAEPECVRIRCPLPRIPLNGEQELLEVTVGGTVRYSCNHGYQLEGARLLTCLANRKLKFANNFYIFLF
jgi:CUB/sushi domain-containing protein